MNKYLGIIKEFGLFLLLFVLASAVAVSEDAYEITVTIVQSSSSEVSDDANTVISTYNSESGLTETSVISGSGSVITDEEDTVATETTDSMDNGNEEDTVPTETTGSEDSGANGDLNPGVMPPDFQLDGLTCEEYNDDLSEWILSMLDEGPALMIDDFPQYVTCIINVE